MDIITLVNITAWLSQVDCLIMVRCAILGCSNKSSRDKCSFYKLPAIICHQGQQMLEITTAR